MMSTRTRQRHPLIRDYLRELDLALAKLPPEKAVELRQQITAHLQDALPQAASAEEVAATLRQLGPPGELAAEAAADGVPPGRAAVALRRLGARLRRARWQSWVAAVVITLLLATGMGRLIQLLTAPLLQQGDTEGWVYPTDYNHAVDTQADGQEQSTSPIRSGQLQGLYINVSNTSDFTQTVLGLVPGSIPFGNAVVRVSEPNFDIDIGGSVANAKYTLPEDVPPGQFRMVEVLWRSSACLARGEQAGIQQIQLRVRVGWLVETDTIPLFAGFYLSGPSQGPCRSRA
jgi:hypothetical protein